MIYIITGASHTGKTHLSQKLLEKFKYPYLSIDHLKMGLIRSGNTNLTVYDDEKLTSYLWPIVREMIKTAVENNQNLIVEGCYVPFNWYEDFSDEYLKNIKYLCLIMSKNYIENNFDNILQNENVIEQGLYGSLKKEELIIDNDFYYKGCIKHNLNCYLIETEYDIKKIIKYIKQKD